MEAVAEFVEHGLDLVDCEQRGRVAGRMGEVADVEDDGALYLAVISYP